MQGKVIKREKKGGLNVGKRYANKERREALKLAEEIGADSGFAAVIPAAPDESTAFVGRIA